MDYRPFPLSVTEGENPEGIKSGHLEKLSYVYSPSFRLQVSKILHTIEPSC